MSLPEIIAATKRQRIGSVAQSILDGRIGIIEGARQIISLRHESGIEEPDPDLLLFVVIESETDCLPLGPVRTHWAADALAKKDVEIAETAAFYHSRVIEVCQRLVARFAHEKIPASAYDYYTPDS